MRSLEETIKATKMCWIGPIECSKCPYKDITSNGNCCAARANDALQYLQEYKELTAELVERNEPLTWDELQTMEGKPVWVEKSQDDEPKGWLLILQTNQDVVNCTTKHGNSFYLYRTLYDGKWQAYRKERSA